MSDFPMRGRREEGISLEELAGALGGSVHNSPEDLRVTGVAPLSAAGPGELGFLADRRYAGAAGSSEAGAFLVGSEVALDLEEDPRPRIVVEDAHAALRAALELLRPRLPAEPGIHSTAVVHPSATVGAEVRIGPYAVVEEGATLGRSVHVGAHSVVGAGVEIGEESVLHPHVVLYPGTQVGARVVIHSGACVGVDGFGYAFVDGGHRKVPQVGSCILQDDVEVGANTTLDRGSIGDTLVGAGVKIDNLVQLGHNVQVGPHSVLAAQTGVAGSTRIGSGVLAGGQAGVAGHLTVGDRARLAAQAGITGDVDPGVTVMGFPARPRWEYLRVAAAQGRVPDLLKRVRRLEAELDALRNAPAAQGGDG